MSTRRSVLLISDSAHGRELATRLQAMGMHPLPAADFAEAERAVCGSMTAVSAALIDVEMVDSGLKGALKRLHRCGPSTGMTVLVFGPAPEKAQRKQLRAAGVRLAVWEPFDDGVLRFQVNRALTGDREDHAREYPRAPTFLVSRVKGGGRSKDAIIYSLSVGGAFLETPRASMDGAHIDVELRLPGHTMVLPAKVIFANVPGNLQRPNLPLGMGVRFVDLDREQSKRIGEYVEQRLSQLSL